MWLAAVATDAPDNSSTAAAATDADFFIDGLLEISSPVTSKPPGGYDVSLNRRQPGTRRITTLRSGGARSPAYKDRVICYS
jgi:hypothetical protein